MADFYLVYLLKWNHVRCILINNQTFWLGIVLDHCANEPAHLEQLYTLSFLSFITFPPLQIPQSCNTPLWHPVWHSWACAITRIAPPHPRWPHYQLHHWPGFMYQMYMWLMDPTVTFPFLDGSLCCFLMIFPCFYFTDLPPWYPTVLLSYWPWCGSTGLKPLHHTVIIFVFNCP